MADSNFRVLPANGGTPREVAEIVNQTVGGKLNCKGSFTCTAGTSSVVTDLRAGANSVILLAAKSAQSAALQPYISANGKQTFTVGHLTATGSESFDYIVIG